MPLTPKRHAFIREYIKDFNGTKAAIRAGYAVKQAHVQAHQLLNNTQVQAELTALRDAATSEAVADHREACVILTAIARANVGDYLDENGHISLAKIRGIHPEAVQSIEERKTVDSEGKTLTITKFRLWDRIRAIERLAKLRGWDQPTKTQVEATVAQTADLSRLTNAELDELEALVGKATADE